MARAVALFFGKSYELRITSYELGDGGSLTQRRYDATGIPGG